MKANDEVEKNSENTFILKMTTTHAYLNSIEKLKGKTENATLGRFLQETKYLKKPLL